jgi:hypothetical protein
LQHTWATRPLRGTQSSKANCESKRSRNISSPTTPAGKGLATGLESFGMAPQKATTTVIQKTTSSPSPHLRHHHWNVTASTRTNTAHEEPTVALSTTSSALKSGRKEVSRRPSYWVHLRRSRSSSKAQRPQAQTTAKCTSTPSSKSVEQSNR